MKKDQIIGAWEQMMGKIKKQWGKITDDELIAMQGRRDELCGAIKKHYGVTTEEAEKQIDDFLNIDES